MDRRQYLQGLGTSGIAALAGCADLLGYEPDDDRGTSGTPTESGTTDTTPPSATPTRSVTDRPSPTRSATPTQRQPPTQTPPASPLPSATPTPTASPTATPTRTRTPDRAPHLVDATLVESWPGAADLDDNAMESVGRGATAVVGFTFDVWAGDGQARITASATVSRRNEAIATRSRTDARVVERADDFTRLSWAIPFDTTDWTFGEHTAEIRLRDRNREGEASPYRLAFDVAQPLAGDEATYVRYEGPDPVTAGESFDFAVSVRNESIRDSSVVSTIEERRNFGEWYEIDESVALNIASENERAFGDEWQVDRPGTYQWRLPGVDVKWRVSVEEPE
jgi:hypothetical protein